jgi:FkbM family methyltransferase
MSTTNDLIRTKMGFYVLQNDTHLSRWIENSNQLVIPYNVAEIASYAHVIPEGGVVINAGACLGDHTAAYAHIVGSQGHVYAFEPRPDTFAALEKNMSVFKNVHVLNCALSDTNGTVNLVLDPNVGASYTTSAEGDVKIEPAKLDDLFLTTFTRCDFIHLDAEGYEPRILLGAQELIRKFRPALVLELCDHHLKRAGSSETELLSLLKKWGYIVFPIPGQVCPEQRDVLALPRMAQ